MNEYINIGIDLGTTNSAISEYANGKVRILKNPRSFSETIPSAISFRGEKAVVGEKAFGRNARVFTSFKRGMGTDETYEVGDRETTPIELSTHVLNELLSIVPGERPKAAVITIPASFDIVQSNATKKAGYEAGLSEVVLLQEPIAGCLAYANEAGLDLDAKQKWLVYDFGGGTFDCALVSIDQRQLKVMDHLGHNFLGGLDIDLSLFNSWLLPKLESEMGAEVASRMTDSAGKPTAFYDYLVRQLEGGKKELSVSDSTVIEIDDPDTGEFYELELSRPTFDEIVAPVFVESQKIMEELLLNNNLSFNDVNQIILIGGTTYIPSIRESIERISGVKVETGVDPTTAIAIGAGYYAGSKKVSHQNEEEEEPEELDLSLTYEPTTKDLEELVAFKAAKSFKGYYSIESGTFSTGLVEFKNEGSVFVPIQASSINEFDFTVFSRRKKPVFHKTISITHGLYSVSGQTLPMDICLELDDEDGQTYLEPIFEKNQVLPIQKTVVKNLSKSINAGGSGNLFINVLEGRRGTLPASNLSIGVVEVSGNGMERDLVKSSQIHLAFSMSESRDLSISVYIPSSNTTIEESFSPHQKSVNRAKLVQEIEQAIEYAKKEEIVAVASDTYEIAGLIKEIRTSLSLLLLDCKDNQLALLHKADERKRSLLQKLDNINRANYVYEEILSYRAAKGAMLQDMQLATPELKEKAQKYLDEDAEVLNSGDKNLIRKRTQEIELLNREIFFAKDENFSLIYLKLRSMPMSEYKESGSVESLFERGDKALEQNDFVTLKNVSTILGSNLKERPKQKPSGGDSSVTGIR